MSKYFEEPKRVRSNSNIKSRLLQPSLTSYFKVRFTIPEFALGTNEQETLELSCQEASLPGSQLATFEITNDYAGVTERYAHRRMYDDSLSLGFYVDANNYSPIKIFERWIGYISGTYKNENIGNRNFVHRLKYPGIEDSGDGYTRPLSIFKFEKSYGTKDENKNSIQYKFVGAYPYSINSMQVSYDSSQLLKCNVQFRYIRYFIVDLDKDASSSSLPDPQQSLINNSPIGFTNGTPEFIQDVDAASGPGIPPLLNPDGTPAG